MKHQCHHINCKQQMVVYFWLSDMNRLYSTCFFSKYILYIFLCLSWQEKKNLLGAQSKQRERYLFPSSPVAAQEMCAWLCIQQHNQRMRMRRRRRRNRLIQMLCTWERRQQNKTGQSKTGTGKTHVVQWGRISLAKIKTVLSPLIQSGKDGCKQAFGTWPVPKIGHVRRD
jgi:hypothetical protein